MIDSLDYVLFVNKSTDNRLAASLKFVYEQIQNMFAVDTKDRFIMLCTFSDGKTPMAIKAIQEAEFKIYKYFGFNNSAMFERNNDIESVDENLITYFKLGYGSFKDFSEYIRDKTRKSVAMGMTKKVIQQREWIEMSSVHASQMIKELTNGFDEVI